MKHHPLANVLAGKPMGRCLDRTHRLAKGDKHNVPSSHMIGGLLTMLRIKDGIKIWVEGKLDEWGEPNFPPVEGEDDFFDDEEEDEFAL